MNAGSKNYRATLEERQALSNQPQVPQDDPLFAPDVDPLGESYVWTARFSRWISLQPETQRETAQGAAVVASGRWIAEITHDPDAADVRPETWRLRLTDEPDRVFNIRGAVDPDGRRRKLIFMLEEGVAT